MKHLANIIRAIRQFNPFRPEVVDVEITDYGWDTVYTYTKVK